VTSPGGDDKKSIERKAACEQSTEAMVRRIRSDSDGKRWPSPATPFVLSSAGQPRHAPEWARARLAENVEATQAYVLEMRKSNTMGP
jgi:hypothetical protein